ncbi:MAG: DUF2950 family protein [Planctomycetes bacterium]|nr:DUF2950 family protein [Planctomycetota bacterium]
MGRRRHGFTLIELMIVIAIIAVIAAIAIPNLKEAQRNSNEAAAISTMRQYLGAQGTYHRTDYDEDGVKEYAAELDTLYDWDGAGIEDPIKLIDHATARAEITNGFEGEAKHRSGFWFADHNLDADGNPFQTPQGPLGDLPPAGYTDNFGLTGIPDRFGRTGIKTFVINLEGTVYEKVLEALDKETYDGAQAGAMPWSMPDIEAQVWLLVN